MQSKPLTVAWISYFPVEWLPDAPDEVRCLPRIHPASWQRVLVGELEKNPAVKLHVIVLRKQFARNLTFARNGVTFHLIKTPGGWRAPTLFWLDTWLIRRKLAEIKPDLVHAWGAEHGAALVATRLKYPFVTTVQGLLTWLTEVTRVDCYHWFAAWLERRSLPRAPMVTTESRFAVDFLKRRWPRMNVRQVEHAPDWIFHRVERQPQTSPVRFIFVGGLSRLKGSDVLLAALDRLKEELPFELLVVGRWDAGFEKTTRKQTSAEIWRRIQFKHDLRPAELAAELARATMMIYPTRADTSPNAVKEAVVAGVPVVASAVGGILDYVWPGRNGILFPPENVGECVQALRAACAHPLFRQGRVEPAALNEAREYLSPRRMGERFLEIYQSLRRPPGWEGRGESRLSSRF
jgi:glycosyltransferase involved in cell wall biosynthesis